MPDDAPFLAAITAAPADRLLKLVYADHLDECGDPRGELVRVEDRLRDVPAFADEFWTLKARRNQLRAAAPPDWLAAMRYGVDVYPVFAHGWPDDWRGRWRLIREFAERWHGVPMGDVGGRRDEVAEVETRIGRALPASVREFVAFRCDFSASIAGWCACATDLIRDTAGQELFVLAELDANVYCVTYLDHAKDDPPAHIYGISDSSGGWDLLSGEDAFGGDHPVSEFVLERLTGEESGRMEFVGLTRTASSLRPELDRLFTSTIVGPMDFYERIGVLARLGPVDWDTAEFRITTATEAEEPPELAIIRPLLEAPGVRF